MASERTARLRAGLGATMLQFAIEVDREFGILAAKRISGGPYAGRWNPTDVLGRGSGATARSLVSGGAGHVFRSQVQGGRVVVSSGSSLVSLAVHEQSGESGSSIKIFSKGNMHRYMWAMYASTKQIFYKIMALKIMRDKFITIRSRPVLKPASEELEQTKLPRLAEQLAVKLFNLWGGGR